MSKKLIVHKFSDDDLKIISVGPSMVLFNAEADDVGNANFVLKKEDVTALAKHFNLTLEDIAHE